MPDHVHMLIFPRNKVYDIGKILGSVKIPVSRNAIKYWENNDPDILEIITITQGSRTFRRFWEAGGGYDREIYKLNTYKNNIEYIHNNPVVKGLCENPSDWKSSSAGWYAGRPNQPLEIDETMPIL